DAGQKVALAEPGYPAYRNILAALDLKPVNLPAGIESGFQPTPALLDAAAKADGIAGLIVASPANPTGSMLTPETLRELVEWCRRRGAWLVSDEIYHGIVYDGPRAATALEFGDDMIVVNSFSKYYSMTGWRIGWMVVPEALVRPVDMLAQNFYVAP